MPGRDYGMLTGIRRVERRDELVPRDSGKPEVANALIDSYSGMDRLAAFWKDGSHCCQSPICSFTLKTN